MTNKLTVDKAKEMLKNPPHGKALSKKQIALFQGVAHGMKPYDEGGELSYNWLDKYEDGGTIGIGLTDKGFNYNSAWGGRFEDGGDVPSKKERLMRQSYAESNWNMNAKSPVGALGPLQIMPNLYNDYSKATGDKTPYKDVVNPSHAVKVRNWALDNIAEADFIKGKKQTEAAKLAKIYGSYNWGRGNMLDYLNKVKAKGEDIYNKTDWTKGLPKETREYLEKVLFRNNKQFETDFQKALKTHPNRNKFVGYEEGGEVSNKKELNVGRRVEVEHKPTLEYIKDYFEKHDKFPTLKQVTTSISKDHIKGFKKIKDPKSETYYKGLVENHLTDEISKYLQGGNVPGSVGFSYSRTGTTPSEGKYAKKTLPSAQDGAEIPEDIIQKYREYTHSPEWYAKSSGRAEMTDSPIDLLLMGWAGGKGIEAGAEFIGKKIIPNIFKANPWKWHPKAGSYYHRTPDLKNIINKETNTLQGFGNSEKGKLFSQLAEQKIPGKINLNKGASSDLYFSKDVPLDWGRYNPSTKIKGFDSSGKPIYYSGQGYEGPYLVETNNVSMKAASQGRVKNYSPTMSEGYAVSDKPISLDDVKFYKEHWLKGYKEIPKKQHGGELQYYQQGRDWQPKTISQKGSLIPGNVQMKNQIINLNHLTDFSNFGKKMKVGGWLDKY